MNVSAARPIPPPARRTVALAGLLLAAAVALAYANSLSGPFVFDDRGAIVDNPTLHALSTSLLPPPGGVTVSGRPLLNLSFAFNYAVGGLRVRGYHTVNLAIHVLAALTLFGVVHRALRRAAIPPRLAAAALPAALATAALWGLHPLATAAVTYTVQRAESLAGLFILLALYGFLQAVERPRPFTWLGLSVLAAVLGVATKETAAMAPLLILLVDRTLVAGRFAAAWRSRRLYYLALAATWVPLALLVLGTQGRGGSAGGNAAITTGSYVLTQCGAIVHYLRLAFWPHPLLFDYGTAHVTTPTAVLPQLLLLAVFLAATIAGLARRPVAALPAAAFFLLLAPSSSLVPIVTQTVAEHRMYLPLAAIAVLAVTLSFVLAGPRTVWAWMAVAAVLGFATARRNTDYRSAVALWSGTVALTPDAPRARNNLGNALFEAGRTDEAIAQLKEAVRLDPLEADAPANLGRAQLHAGQPAAAVSSFTQALRLRPDDLDSRQGLARALLRTGRTSEALGLLQELRRLAPDRQEVRNDLGSALAILGRPDEAVVEFAAAVRLDPADADAHYNLGNALLQIDRPAEALEHYEAAVRLRPADAEARQNRDRLREQLRHP